MNPLEVLSRSRALWNRERLDLESDEILAQILDRGSLEDWRALYQLLGAEGDQARRLRQRVHAVLFKVPTGRPHFWLAVLAELGHAVDWAREPKRDPGEVEL